MNPRDAYLTPVYENLQLDPKNAQQLVTFKKLCWQHILDHSGTEWVQKVQSGDVRLRWYNEYEDRKRSLAYNDTLEAVTFKFLQLYANRIWPLRQDMRSHLACTFVGAGVRAEEWQMRAGSAKIEHLARTRRVPADERMIMLESKIGSRVREFFLRLVVTTRAPLRSSCRSAEQLLLSFLGREDEFATTPHDDTVVVSTGTPTLETTGGGAEVPFEVEIEDILHREELLVTESDGRSGYVTRWSDWVEPFEEED
jgi:hypothetical protein